MVLIVAVPQSEFPPKKTYILLAPPRIIIAEWRMPKWEAWLRLSATEPVGCGGSNREDAICQHPLKIMRHSNGKPMGLSLREYI